MLLEVALVIRKYLTLFCLTKIRLKETCCTSTARSIDLLTYSLFAGLSVETHFFLRFTLMAGAIFARGDYKVALNVSVGVQKEHLVTVTAVFTRHSTNKDSFG